MNLSEHLGQKLGSPINEELQDHVNQLTKTGISALEAEIKKKTGASIKLKVRSKQGVIEIYSDDLMKREFKNTLAVGMFKSAHFLGENRGSFEEKGSIFRGFNCNVMYETVDRRRNGISFVWDVVYYNFTTDTWLF